MALLGYVKRVIAKENARGSGGRGEGVEVCLHAHREHLVRALVVVDLDERIKARLLSLPLPVVNPNERQLAAPA